MYMRYSLACNVQTTVCLYVVCVCVCMCVCVCVCVVCVCVCAYRAVHREELKLLQQRVSDCVKREEVNHLQEVGHTTWPTCI